jgi:hypothetical protein
LSSLEKQIVMARSAPAIDVRLAVEFFKTSMPGTSSAMAGQ